MFIENFRIIKKKKLVVKFQRVTVLIGKGEGTDLSYVIPD